MNLPIEILPGQPRRFRWKQTFTTPVGTRTVEHTGTLPLNVEDSVIALINVCKQLLKHNQELHERSVAAEQRENKLQKQLDGAYERIAKQSDALGKAAEKSKNDVEENPTDADPAQIENAKPWASKLDKPNKKDKS